MTDTDDNWKILGDAEALKLRILKTVSDGDYDDLEGLEMLASSLDDVNKVIFTMKELLGLV